MESASARLCSLTVTRLAAGLALSGGWAMTTSAAPFFSEYVEGSSYNKALEIYSAEAYDLSANGCQVQIYFNGNTTAGSAIDLTGSIPAGGTYVLAHSSATDILDVATQSNSSVSFNGDDAVTLVCNSVTLDIIGQIGTDPGTEWGSNLTSTQD